MPNSSADVKQHPLLDGGASPARAVGCYAFVAILVLLPFGRSSEAGVLLLLVLGGWLLTMRAPLAQGDTTRLVVAMFACWWLPQLISAFDAVAPAKTWPALGVALRLLPIAIVAAWALGDADWRNRVALVIAAIVAIWTLDALVQGLVGVGLRGRMSGDRVSGIFGNTNLKLGPILAVLTPWPLHLALVRWGRKAALVTWVLIAIAVLLAGTRGGWVAFALVSIAFAWRLASRKRDLAWIAVALLVALVAFGAVAMRTSELFADRIDRTLRAVDGNSEDYDYALAGRLPIWRNAIAMTRDHPINGVGMRGFRFAYPDYAPPGDPWLDASGTQGANHPHQLVLETAAETGAIGIVGWLIMVGLAWRAWRRAPADAKRAAWPAAVALLAMCWPFNTHFAFYSSFWGLLSWWLVAYFASAVGRPSLPIPAPAPALAQGDGKSIPADGA